MNNHSSPQCFISTGGCGCRVPLRRKSGDWGMRGRSWEEDRVVDPCHKEHVPGARRVVAGAIDQQPQISVTVGGGEATHGHPSATAALGQVAVRRWTTEIQTFGIG